MKTVSGNNDKSSIIRMWKLYFSIVFLFPRLILSQTIHSNEISEEYAQEQFLIQNIVNTISHAVDIRPASRISYYCVLLSSPPSGRPSVILNMLQLTLKSQIIINTWPNTTRNMIPKSRNCSNCEHFFIFTEMTDIEKVLNEVDVTCTGERIEFLFIICDVFDTEIEAQKSAEFIVNLAWNQHRGFAIVLIPVGSRVLIFKSKQHIPYELCRPEPPTMMSYLENGILMGNISFEPLGYNKCVLRIASGTCWGRTRLEISNGTVVIVGFEGLVLNTISDEYGFTMNVMNPIPPKQLQPKNSSTGMTPEKHPPDYIKEHLQSGKSDLAVCSLWISYREDMKFTHSYVSHEVILMIPVPLYIPFSSIFNTFSKLVWICVMLGLIAGRILIRMDRRSISSLMALALFLGVSATSKSRGFVEKWQYILWVVYGYLITQSYIASLVSVLNNPSVRVIETLDELADSDYRVAGYSQYLVSFEDIGRYTRIVNTFIAMNQSEYNAALNDPEQYIPPAKKIAILVNILDKERWRPRYYPIKDRVFYHLAGMAAMARSTVSLREFDQTILHLAQNGLLLKWFDMESKRIDSKLNFTDIETPSPTLNLKEETGIFVLLAVGLSLSILVFIYEIYKKK